MITRRLSRFGVIALGLWVVAAGSGCGLQPKPTGERAGRPPGERAPASPFEPTTLRIHPLTRIVLDEESGERRIEVFLELLDRWNHGVKALGSVVLELYDTGGPAGAGGSRQLQLWKVDLTDPDANAEPYDRVTRTYHLSLASLPPGLPVERDLQLRVRFTSMSGNQLVATHRFAGR